MTRLLAVVALLCLASSAVAQDLETGRQVGYVRTKTFQSLLWQPGIAGHYLTVDPQTLNRETAIANLTLSSVSNIEHANSYWQLRSVYTHRGYRGHVIVNRGNSPLNNRKLGLDQTTGKFIFTEGEVPTSYWLVRYAGKYNGWDAYFIQTLAETTGGFDLSFVTVDPATKAITLSPTPTPGSYWHIADTSDLPAETR
jgi:hypothetical protein